MGNEKNKLIVYKHGYELGYDFMSDICAVDAEVYAETGEGARYRGEGGSFIFALCDSRIIGCACFSFEGTDVIINSITVLPDFQRRGVGKNLLRRLFAHLAKETEDGRVIKNAYAYAHTEQFKALLRYLHFVKIGGGKNGTPYMRYTLNDYAETNMYLFVPFFVNGNLDPANLLSCDGEDNSYLELLAEISNKEFSSLSADIKRGFIGKEKFIIVDDNDKKVLCDNKECKIYLTAYKNFYVATIALTGLGYEPATVLHQAAGNTLYINSDGKKLPFNIYLAQRFGLKQTCQRRCVNMTGAARCFRQAYGAKCFTTLTAKPQESRLAHMLACEYYAIKDMDETLTSEMFFEKARRNLEEHQFSQIYASEKSVVYVLTEPEKNRLLHEARMAFIIELLSLQICALSSNYDEVVAGLDKREFSRRTIENVNFRYSRAAMLWDINNFRYLSAKNIFGALSKEFGISTLKQELNENLNTFEKMTVMDLQKKVEQHSKSSKKLLAFFSVVAGITALSSLVNLFYNAVTQKDGGSVTALIVCAAAAAALGVTGIFLTARNNRRMEREKDARCHPKNCKHDKK